MATFNATIGTDVVTQTTGADTLVITNTNQIQSSDVFDGSTGTDTISISGAAGVTVNVTAAGATTFKNYDALSFDNTTGVSTFEVNASQIGATLGQLPANLVVNGAAGQQIVSILNASTFTAANWTFTNWGTDDLFKITGTSGNDGLTGSIVKDELRGGIGNDTYTVQNTDDVIIENAGEGTDGVFSSVSYTLGDNVDNLTLSGTSNNNATGNTGNNTLTGNSGNNVLDGAGGTDSLVGGAGNDTYIVDDATDTLTEGAGAGTDTVQAAYSFTLATNFENLTLAGTDNLSGTGNSANNTITGNTGNNALNGAGGTDTMIGGDGDDSYIVDDATDVVTEAADEGTDTVSASINYTLTSNVENLILTGAAALTGTGNDLDNTLTGNSGNNTLTGGLGNDTLVGGGGTDTMLGGAGDDTYTIDDITDVVTEAASEGTDTVNSSLSYTLGSDVENLVLTGASALSGIGNDLNNSLTGNSGNNTLDGGLGNDILVGGGGTDTMIGGFGDDTYTVDDATDVVTEASNAGTDTVNSAITHTLAATLENLTLTGTGIINGTGNDLNNVLVGNSAKNILTGGLGNDTYYVQTSADVVVESSSTGGTDTVYAEGGFTLGSNVENLVLQSLTGVTATGNGNGLNNVITGGLGNDFIDGKTGADTMAGGLGDDKYYIDNVGDSVSEDASAGIDTVNSSITHSLGANFENLTLLGGSVINGTGNSLANILIGNTAGNILSGGALSDTLDGKGGADNMKGGTGNDIYWVDVASDVCDETGGSGNDTVNSAVNYTLAAGLENLTLTSAAAALTATGNSADNILIGNNGANTLTGLEGNDRLDGKSGIDTMVGGTGDDIYVIDNTADIINEVASEGTDTAEIKVNYTLGSEVENLTMTGSSGITGTGNGLNNTMIGNIGSNVLFGMAGNDVIDGKAGVDDMHGGTGDDTFYVDNVADDVFESASEGTDTVISTKSFTLDAYIEHLTLSGPQIINGTGNDLNNTITGNGNKNILDGKVGTDTLAGGAGDDTYIVDADDILVEVSGEGTDLVKATFTYTLSTTQDIENLTLVGSTDFNGTGNTLANVITGGNGANVLSGLAGADTLLGFGGMDTLAGGTGADILTGGGLDDVFLFSVLADSNSANGVDNITDFTSGDKINVSAIDAIAGGADNAFVADSNGTFVAGEYSVVTDVDGYVFVNFYNDAVAGIDMQIRVKAAALSDVDFVL